MKKASFVSLALLVALLVTAFLPNSTALAQDKGLGIPNPISPIGVGLDRTPTFVWEPVNLATYYQLQVFDVGSGLKVLDVTKAKSAICDASSCEYTTTKNLAYNDFYWRVRAKTSYSGKWSEETVFVVSSPNFNFGFNNSLWGWEAKNDVGGTWVARPTFAFTYGKADKWSNLARVARGGKYNDFDYTTIIKRVDGVISGRYPANCAVVRMGAYTTSGKYLWYPGYRFCVTDSGKWGVFYVDLDASTNIIYNWRLNAAVNKFDWNTLRVVAVGPDFQFYINGTLVKSFTEESKDRGYVGVSGWKNLGTSTRFLITNAKLTVVTSATAPVGFSSAGFEPVEMVPMDPGYYTNSD
jgi:hypothetical protein